MSVAKHVKEANKAMRRGDCLAAGMHIDKAYVAYGKSGKGLASIKRADAPFEKKCVKKHPSKNNFGSYKYPSIPSLQKKLKLK